MVAFQRYTFWNVHEQQRGKYDFSDASRANLTRLFATAAEVGLFVNVRLGPFVCAEWNFGGLPVCTWRSMLHPGSLQYSLHTGCSTGVAPRGLVHGGRGRRSFFSC